MREHLLTLFVRYFAACFTLACLAIPWVIPLTGPRVTVLGAVVIVGAMVYLATFMDEKS